MPGYFYETRLQTLPSLAPATHHITSASVGKQTDPGEQAGLAVQGLSTTVLSLLGLGTVVFELDQTQFEGRVLRAFVPSVPQSSPHPTGLSCGESAQTPFFLVQNL